MKGDLTTRDRKGQSACASAPSFRMEVQLHDLLMKGKRGSRLLQIDLPQTLPEPIFPQRPEALGDVRLDAVARPNKDHPYQRRWTAPLIYRAMRGWLFPYIRSRVLPGTFTRSLPICSPSGNATSIVTIAGPSTTGSKA